ncbi:MAG: response regulator transcription factor [Deltaproteobacteria bacterium]|nr:response regulator transcription factor [Deltaproteobacteria bacterium]
MTATINVLIVDDHAILREGIRALLAAAEDMVVVGEAANGQEAIERVEERRPDVVLMDIAMPGLGGLEATRQVCVRSKVLILTQYDNPEYIYRAFKSGALGYILKRALGSELLTAIRAVHRGRTYLDPTIASDVIAGYLRDRGEHVVTDPYELLTDRERQVLKLFAEGCTAKEVATVLKVSVKTAGAHRDNLMRKLGLHNRAALVRFAIEKGVLSGIKEGEIG